MGENLKSYDASYVISQSDSPKEIQTAKVGDVSNGIATTHRLTIEKNGATSGTVAVSCKFVKAVSFRPMKDSDGSDLIVDLSQEDRDITLIGDVAQFKLTLSGVNGDVAVSLAGWQ